MNDFFTELLNRIRLLFFISICFGLLIFILTFFVSDKFESEALFSIKESNQFGSSQMLSDVGGFARLAGITLGSTSGGLDKTTLAMETIVSRDFFFELQKEINFLPRIFAFKKYDKSSNLYKFDNSKYDFEKNIWKGRYKKVDANVYQKKLHENFLNNLTLELNPRSGLINITFIHNSPEVAQKSVEVILETLDNLQRKKDLREFKKSLEVLRSEEFSSKYKEVELSISSLAQSELNKLMMAEVSENYFINVIDKPSFSEEKINVSKILVFFVGFFISIFIQILIIAFLNKSKKED